MGIGFSQTERSYAMLLYFIQSTLEQYRIVLFHKCLVFEQSAVIGKNECGRSWKSVNENLLKLFSVHNRIENLSNMLKGAPIIDLF